MHFTNNLLQVDQPRTGLALFLRLRYEVPALVESPELLELPATGTWQPTTPAQPEAPAAAPIRMP